MNSPLHFQALFQGFMSDLTAKLASISKKKAMEGGENVETTTEVVKNVYEEPVAVEHQHKVKAREMPGTSMDPEYEEPARDDPGLIGETRDGSAKRAEPTGECPDLPSTSDGIRQEEAAEDTGKEGDVTTDGYEIPVPVTQQYLQEQTRRPSNVSTEPLAQVRALFHATKPLLSYAGDSVEFIIPSTR